MNARGESPGFQSRAVSAFSGGGGSSGPACALQCGSEFTPRKGGRIFRKRQTPEGKTVKLSDYVGKGKVVLVDFWASWCGPCRREMPNLVEAYAKYKNKNFEIVGVSLDQSADAWKEAIKKLNITWPQMSDLKYWNCEGAQLYAVSSIPHTVLIDGEGTILARGLHGDELQEKIAEAVK